MKKGFIKVQAIVLLLMISSVFASPPAPYGPLPSEAQLQWHQLEQYAFCHFTINAFTDKEWGYGDESPELFDPTDFDADEIVQVAKAAGLKAFVLTCKHHDGFCLWPTKTTGHNISKSPWKNGQGDLVKEFSDAARRHGLKFGVYLSPWDRNNTHYGTPEYINVFRAQLTELLMNYGEICEIWFDGANGGDGYYAGARETRKIDRSTYYDWENTWKICRKLQPNAVIFSDVGPDIRWCGSESGFAKYPCWATYTPVGLDGKKPAPGAVEYKRGLHGTVDGKYWLPAEVNFPVRPGWFYHKSQDSKVKTPKQLLDRYFSAVGFGGSFFPNLSPDQRGRLHANDVYALTTFGNIIRELYSKNYAEGATVSAGVIRKAGSGEDYSPSNVLDRDIETYWATPDGTKSATVTVELDGVQQFDVIRLGEPIHLGQRIRKFIVDVRVNGQWRQWVKNGSSVGAHVLFRKDVVSADAVRIRILESAACPLLSEVSLWKLPEEIPDSLPVASNAKKISKSQWTIKSDSTERNVFDGRADTFWRSDSGTVKPPQKSASLVIDLGKVESFSAIEILPRQDGLADGVIDQYCFQWSIDGDTWSESLKGEFSNIRNNPITQTVSLNKSVYARYLKVTALRVLEKDFATIAEIYLVK